MKQKIKNLFTPNARPSTHNVRGFTLIEIAMVLIVVGLLLTMGIALFGTLTKRAKVIESREAVKQAKEAVLGYAVKNGFLPATLEAAGARRLDSWTRDIQYNQVNGLAPEIDASGENACSVNTTTLAVIECVNAACSSKNEKLNIAFIVYSKGEDANDYGTLNPPSGVTCPTTKCFYVREQASSYTDGATYDYDDIVQYVSLDEIRSLRGCPQQLVITSPNALDQGEEDSFYSYSLQAIGGAPPYQWGILSGGTCDVSGTTPWSGSGISLNRDSGLISGTINYCCSSGCTTTCSTNTGELAACPPTPNIDVDNICVRDSSGGTAGPQNFDISVRPKPLKITTEILPSGTVNAFYSATLSGSGGRSSYTWTVASGSLPTGLTLSGGVISGTPTAAGQYNFVIQLADTCTTIQKSFSITINSAAAGTGLSCTLSATSPITSGSTSTLTWSINNGPADTGTFNPTSGGCTSFTSSSGGNCTTSALSSTTTFGLTVTKGTETSSCSVTVYVNPASVPPSCTLEASPNPVTTGNPTSLIWTVNNGPATATFSPTSGACGTFTNSYGGNCNTNNINANTTFQLSVTKGTDTGLCATTVYTTSQDFCSTITVRNTIGASIYVKGGQYGTTCRRIRDNRTFNVNYSDTSAVTLWQNSTCTSNPQDIDSVSYNNSIPADAYAASTDADRDCAVAIDEVATNNWELVDE